MRILPSCIRIPRIIMRIVPIFLRILPFLCGLYPLFCVFYHIFMHTWIILRGSSPFDTDSDYFLCDADINGDPDTFDFLKIGPKMLCCCQYWYNYKKILVRIRMRQNDADPTGYRPLYISAMEEFLSDFLLMKSYLYLWLNWPEQIRKAWAGI